MTLARKDFKNIYESGIKELSDIEAQAIEKAKQIRAEHSKKQKQSAQQSIEQLEKKSGLLQVELKQSINDSLKKIQDTLTTEYAQSDAFLSSLMTELKTLTEQMKVKLKALKQSHHENVDFARMVASEHYLTNTEERTFDLEHALSGALHTLNAKGKANLESLQINLEKTLTEIQSAVSEATESNLVSSRKLADTIVDHSSTLLQSLFVDSQAKLNELESSARRANSEVESSNIALLERVENHATVVEKDINKNYEDTSTAHFQNADNRLSKFADELSALHDTTTEQLVSMTEDLANDLLTRSTQVQDNLHSRCDDVVKRVDTLFNAFQEKLNSRLQFSRGQKQALESDKNRILSAVQNELLSIQKSFAKKIAGMLDQSKSELTDMTKSVEGQIMNATESLTDQMNDSAKSIQKQIESEVAKFLKELSATRNAAIDEISTAAKGNSPKPKPTTIDSDIYSSPLDTPESDLLQIKEESLSDDLISQNDIFLEDESESQDVLSSEDLGTAETKPKRNRRRRDNKE